MTSRYQPMEKDGEILVKCRKIDDLRVKKEGGGKKKGKGEGEKRLGEGRGKKKERQLNLNLRRLNVNEVGGHSPLVEVRDN